MTSPNTDPVESTEQAGPDFTIDATPQKPSRGRRLPGAGRTSAQKDSVPKGPRARRESTSDKAAFDVPDYIAGRIGGALKETYGKIGMMWGMFDPMIGETIVANAESMANSMEKLAKESPRTRVFLEKLIATTAIGEVVSAHAPVAAVIGMRYIPALRKRANTMAAQMAGSGMNGNADTSGTQGPDNLRAV
jgi:hypothetical protein